MSSSTAPGLARLILEDRRAHGSWLKPGFHAMAAYRLGVWRRTLPRLIRWPFTLLYWLLRLWVRNVYGIHIPATAVIGRRVIIPNGGAVLIAAGAVVGDDCVIRHNVTVAAARSMRDVPTLGDSVKIATGAVILGPIKIGDRAEIGPNAVVLTDVPPGATVFAHPARVVVGPRPAWAAEEDHAS